MPLSVLGTFANLAIDNTSKTMYENAWGDQMKKYTGGYQKTGKIATLILLLGLCACSKKEDGTTPVSGTLPGRGPTTTMTYTGVINQMDTTSCFQQCRQSVSTNANVIDYPTDDVTVYLCRNTDCVNGPVPSVQCATLALGSPTPCYTGIPYPIIVLGKNVVVFINAFEKSYVDAARTIPINGFSSYVITTAISR
jgi:hypothetical protein